MKCYSKIPLTVTIVRDNYLQRHRRGLQCAIYPASRYPQFKTVRTNNNLNFIVTIDDTVMGSELVHGL
jgi:hypothetical protein